MNRVDIPAARFVGIGHVVLPESLLKSPIAKDDFEVLKGWVVLTDDFVLAVRIQRLWKRRWTDSMSIM